MTNVAIIGSTGAIGHAFTEHYAAQDNVSNIFACARNPKQPDNSKVYAVACDICDEASLEKAVATIRKQTDHVDVVILATGLLHNEHVSPEKSLRDITSEAFDASLRVNVIGTALVAKYFTPLLPRDRRAIFAVLSARVGSISDNRLGGWYAYRASKAAVNMLVKTTAIEVGRKYDQAVIVGLHPGTVDSHLSAPFQTYVKEGKLFTPDYSVSQLTDVIDKLSPDDSGKCFAWDGEEIQP